MVESKFFTIVMTVLSTGVALELIRRLVPSNDKKMSNEQAFQKQLLDMQKEMRDDVNRLENEIISLRKELDVWRDRYYKLLDEYNKLKRIVGGEKM